MTPDASASLQRRSTVALVVLASLAWSTSSAAKPSFDAVAPQPILVEARPIVFDRERPQERRFGALEWLGGVELTSASPLFGGISGLLLTDGGRRLTAVSDAGLWLAGELAYERDRVVGLARVRIGSLLGNDGRPLKGIRDTDAEAITPAGPGRVYVGFERRHRLAVYRLTSEGLGRLERTLRLPRALRRASSNSGVEGVAVLRAGTLKGALVLFTESLRDEDGNIQGWLLAGKKSGSLALKPRENFAVTDLAALANGDLLVLERHFSWATGVRMRIRRIAAGEIRPGAVIDGDVLIEAGPSLNIDNMEAMAVHETERGETVITLMSDDNYRFLQRTLLLQFLLPAAKAGGR